MKFFAFLTSLSIASSVFALPIADKGSQTETEHHALVSRVTVDTTLLNLIKAEIQAEVSKISGIVQAGQQAGTRRSIIPVPAAGPHRIGDDRVPPKLEGSGPSVRLPGAIGVSDQGDAPAGSGSEGLDEAGDLY